MTQSMINNITTLSYLSQGYWCWNPENLTQPDISLEKINSSVVYAGNFQEINTVPWELIHQAPQGILYLHQSVIDKLGMPDNSFQSASLYAYLLKIIRTGIPCQYLSLKTGSTSIKTHEAVLMLKQLLGYVPHSWVSKLAQENLEADHTETDFTHEYYRLLSAYNADLNSLEFFRRQSHDSPHFSTWQVMQNLGFDQQPYKSLNPAAAQLVHSQFQPQAYPHLKPVISHIKSLLNDLGQPSVYNMGNRNLMFDGYWRTKVLEQAVHVLEKLKQERKKDTCIVVGNGPSLNASNFDLLKGQDVFISNYAVQNPQLLACAKYLAVTNYLVAEQAAHLFNDLKSINKFFPYWLRYCLHEDKHTIFLNAQGGQEFFSTNILECISWHSTVTHFHLQLAYFLGYKKVLMIGFDHSYKQIPGAKEGDILECKEDDPNHFNADYFKGKKWQAADVGNMEKMYEMAKKSYQAQGRKILNCTVGGHLEVFPRSTLETELS